MAGLGDTGMEGLGADPVKVEIPGAPAPILLHANIKQTPASAAGRSKKRGRPPKPAAGGRGGAGGAAGAGSIASVPANSDLLRVVRIERGSRAGGAAGDPAEGAGRVLLSRLDRAAQLTLSDDRMGVSGVKGFRSIRTTHGALEGAWYCEASITHLGPTGHARLGWATRKAELQASVGFDKHGYTFRDVDGSKVHNGKREPYGQPFTQGDVVGLYAYLPPAPTPVGSRSVVRYKGALFYLDVPEPEPVPLLGSAFAFSLNGVSQGVAFRDVLEGSYHAAASLFTRPEQAEGAAITFNFGPDFAFPPPALDDLPAPRPLSELTAVAAETAAAAVEEAAAAAATAAMAVASGAGTLLSLKSEPFVAV